MSGIGYREVVEYLQDGASSVGAGLAPAQSGRPQGSPLRAVIERVKFDTHAYARRQLTWFRKDKRIRWVADADEAIGLVEGFLG